MNRAKKILIVLGGSNDEEGLLSEVTISRLNLCLDTYEKGDQIICTGGWGANFNQTEKPHAIYAQKYLMKKGIVESAFLETALSRNTVEDAVKAKQILQGQSEIKLVVISSDFHLERVELIFNQVFHQNEIEYLAASSHFLGAEREAYMKHEQKAIAWIRQNGLKY